MLNLLLVLLLAGAPVPTVEATVVRVIDGDTFEVEAYPWPRETVSVRVRVHAVDTPEKGGKAKCDEERRLGAKATKFARSTLRKGSTVYLTGVDDGSFAKRVVAGVLLSDGRDYAALLIERGLGRKYDVREGRKSWCPAAAHVSWGSPRRAEHVARDSTHNRVTDLFGFAFALDAGDRERSNGCVRNAPLEYSSCSDQCCPTRNHVVDENDARQIRHR